MSDDEQGDVPHFRKKGDAFLFDPPEDQKETARRRREDEQHEFARQQVKTNGRIALFTGILVLATIAGSGIAIWQATIAQTAANAARDSAATSEKSLAETQRSNRVQEQRSQAALQASIDSLQEDQRAWVGPVGAFPPAFTDSGRSVYVKVGEKYRFGFDILNTGKTPARRVKATLSAHVYGANQKFVPDYRVYYKQPKEHGTVTELFPNVRMQVQSEFGQFAATKSEVDALLKGKTILYVYGEISYTDVFDKPHVTTFCSFVSKDLLSLISCDTYNDAK